MRSIPHAESEVTGVVRQAFKRALGRSWRVLLGRGRLETTSRLWMALVLFLVIGSSSYLMARRTWQHLTEQMSKQAKLVADAVLAQRAADAQYLQAFERDPGQFPHPLQQDFLTKRGFRWRQIYQAGTFIVPPKVEEHIPSYQAQDEWEQYYLDAWAEAETRTPVHRRTKDPMTGQRLFQWLTPVTAEDSCQVCHSDFAPRSFQGMLSIELPFGRERRELYETRAIMIGSAVVALGVALVTLYLLMRHLIIKPLHRLKETTDAVAMGELQARAEVSTGDELEEFAHALNHMIESVQESHRAQAELNRSLDAQLDALGRANLELHEMNQVRTEFLANMSHELRSPLHSVLGFAQILLEETFGPLTARQRRYVQNMVSSGRDLLDLINNLLDMSRIEAGRMQKNLDRVSLAELVRSVVAKSEPLRSDRLSVAVEVPEALPPILLDPRKTSRILSNLLSNAYKFTPEGGRVEVSAKVEGDRLVLSVSDTGIGISERDLPRIFDKFRQVESGGGRRFEGSGLGLAIVRELARFLGGEVTVQSAPEQGSTFTVVLPLVAGEAEERAPASERVEAPAEPAGE